MIPGKEGGAWWKTHPSHELQSLHSFTLTWGREAPRSLLAWKPQFYEFCGTHPPQTPLLVPANALKAH